MPQPAENRPTFTAWTPITSDDGTVHEVLNVRLLPAVNACRSHTCCMTRADAGLYTSTSTSAVRVVDDVTVAVIVTTLVRATVLGFAEVLVVKPPDDSEADADELPIPTAATKKAVTSPPTSPIRARAPVVLLNICIAFRH